MVGLGERMSTLLGWLAEWRDDQHALLRELPDDDTRLALEGELAELGERVAAEVEGLRALGVTAEDAEQLVLD